MKLCVFVKKICSPMSPKDNHEGLCFLTKAMLKKLYLQKKKKIKNQTFIPIIDALITNLNSQNEANSKINEKFGFF